MTTASSSPGSAAPDCYGTHYTQLLSAAGQLDTAENMGNTRPDWLRLQMVWFIS